MAKSGRKSKRFSTGHEKRSATTTAVLSQTPYFLIVHYRPILYFLIFSSNIERSTEIGISLADGGAPVENLSQGYPDADSDTVLGEKFPVIASGRPLSFELSAAT
jgi:hypothetical protein